MKPSKQGREIKIRIVKFPDFSKPQSKATVELAGRSFEVEVRKGSEAKTDFSNEIVFVSEKPEKDFLHEIYSHLNPLVLEPLYWVESLETISIKEILRWDGDGDFQNFQKLLEAILNNSPLNFFEDLRGNEIAFGGRSDDLITYDDLVKVLYVLKHYSPNLDFRILLFHDLDLEDFGGLHFSKLFNSGCNLYNLLDYTLFVDWNKKWGISPKKYSKVASSLVEEKIKRVKRESTGLFRVAYLTKLFLEKERLSEFPKFVKRFFFGKFLFVSSGLRLVKLSLSDSGVVYMKFMSGGVVDFKVCDLPLFKLLRSKNRKLFD